MVSTWRNVHAGETIDKAGFSFRASSHFYWLFKPRGICPRWHFNRKFCRWILHGTRQLSVLSNITRGELVVTILTCNLTSTLQGLDIATDALITFCFTSVSCAIQIRQLIDDIKCASALTVMNTRILLKATSYNRAFARSTVLKLPWSRLLTIWYSTLTMTVSVEWFW